jgi:hypothetical protein
MYWRNFGFGEFCAMEENRDNILRKCIQQYRKKLLPLD